MSDAADDPAGAAAPSDAFQVLGNETRMTVLQALVESDEDGVVAPVSRTFSELYEATDEDTTAGFAYHLRQLTGHYVRKEDDEYRLTYAGIAVVRAIAAGTYTRSVDRGPIPLGDDCPLCGDAGLEATVVDNVMTVGCTACCREVLALPFPPGGHRTHDDADLPAAFDRHHRHRIALLADGVCPECGGAVDGRIVDARGEPDDTPDGATAERPRAAFDCRACGARLRCPVALCVLDHPAVVSLYHEHGVDVRERPVWNVGAEWREAVLSTDPVCVRVSTRVGDDVLALFVGRDLTVVEVERTTVQNPDPNSNDADDETEREADAAPA